MDKIQSQVTILVVACILVAVGIFIYVQIESHSVDGRLILRCELPTERPTMSALAVNYSNISNCSEARSYAAQYFPQFSNVTFEESESGYFYAVLNEETIRVPSNGRILYSRDYNDDVAVSTEEFPVEVARSSSIYFIERHGGLGDYTEYSVGSGRKYSTDDPSSFKIISYDFVYYRKYNEYTIFGADAIQTSIRPENFTLGIYSRGEYELGNSTETGQVISAKTAWNVVVEANYHIEDIDITEVELCYYYPYDEDVITVLYPSWRYSGPEIDFYVNAFNGEFIE